MGVYEVCYCAGHVGVGVGVYEVCYCVGHVGVGVGVYKVRSFFVEVHHPARIGVRGQGREFSLLLTFLPTSAHTLTWYLPHMVLTSHDTYLTWHLPHMALNLGGTSRHTSRYMALPGIRRHFPKLASSVRPPTTSSELHVCMCVCACEWVWVWVCVRVCEATHYQCPLP